MELRPGRRFEMSSHFMPLPRSSMMRASSSGDHLLCFFAGDSDVCCGMLRFPPPLPGRDPNLELGACDDETLCPLALAPAPAAAAPGRGDNGPAATANEASGGPPEAAAATAADRGTDVDAGWGCWAGDTEDSFESEPLRREAISTVTVSRRTCLRGQRFHGRPTLCAWQRAGSSAAKGASRRHNPWGPRYIAPLLDLCPRRLAFRSSRRWKQPVLTSRRSVQSRRRGVLSWRGLGWD